MASLTPTSPSMHLLNSGGHKFLVDSHYSYIRSIGSGAYGVVISALDSRTGSKLAIKKVPNAFADEIDGKRILREIKVSAARTLIDSDN